MKKTYLGKSLYTKYSIAEILKELNREFKLSYSEAFESPDEFFDMALVTVIVECNAEDSMAIQVFLNRFDTSRG